MTSKERIQKIYFEYLNSITPLIEQYEILENKFPVGIFNEIRALLTHIAKAENMSGDERTKEISKAESHVTRLLRDCYKYNCVALENKYMEYMAVLQKTVSSSNNLCEIVKKHNEALDALFVAKCLESSIESYQRENEIYENYKKAFDIYSEIRTQLCTLIKSVS